METKAMRDIARKMERELTERKPGAIRRLADLYRQRTNLRLQSLGARPL